MKKIFFISLLGVIFLTGFFLSYFFICEIIMLGTDSAVIRPLAPAVSEKKTIEKKKPIFLDDFENIKKDFISASSSFLEISFFDMKTRMYKNGNIAEEINIIKRGDPQDWGGSATGLYQAISKRKAAFSGSADVYMPYAVNYYGKYYLHGEPYYPNGEKRVADFTGGCAQFSDADAKKIFDFAEIGTPILVIDKLNDAYDYSSKSASDFPEISAKSYLAADIDSGFVFSEKNSKDKLPIASLTKLMTALVVSENIDLRKDIAVKDYMLDSYGSTTDLTSGKRFKVVELFYPLLEESSNDAAKVLSYFLGRVRTIELMNDKAKAILMEETAFADAHGLSPENISTARDLFYLARYIFNNKYPLLKITKGENIDNFGALGFKNLKNKNLFSAEQNFIGGKTGYIIASKYNGMFLFCFPLEDGSERRIAIIILGENNLEAGEENLKNDVEKINIWLKENYFET